MASLIPAPVLDDRNEEQFAAEMIGRVTGSLDVDRILSQLVTLRDLHDLVAGGMLPPPVCPELTNANPSSPHTVILEVLGWAMAQQARKINQLPVRDEIAFANLFLDDGIRPATKATTTLRFTTDGQHDATIPAGTIVGTGDGTLGQVVEFTTDEDLFIPADVNHTTGEVSATCTAAGYTLLSSGTLTYLRNSIAFVAGVINPSSIDSGTGAETVEQALQRARSLQRRGRRLVSAQDFEDSVLYDVMNGAGIVKAFPLVMAGDFSSLNHPKAGHTTMVVMTPAGNPVSDTTKAAIVDMLNQAIGAQFIYVIDPQYVYFTVEANVKIAGLTPQATVLAGIEKRLRDFYAPKTGNFGRKILRSEIIAIIEGTPGVDRIQSDDNGPIVQSPNADYVVLPYQMPRLNAVPGGVLLHAV
jgi:hypothetical protein